MGAGIAEVLAAGGHQVIGVEADERARARGEKILATSTDRAVDKGKRSREEADALLGRITFAEDLAAVAECELVIEAVSENLDLKRSIFARLDEVVTSSAVLASNTSSLPVTAIAGATAHPERVLGVHFFNPAPVQKLVEVIETVHTDPSVVERVQDLLTELGKTTIRCGDRAGFVVNALLIPYLNRAATLYQDGFATREEIDQAMVDADSPMGPLRLMDLVGLDVCVAVLDALYDETKDHLHAATPLLRRLVMAGWLGAKTGRGWYDSSDASWPGPVGTPRRSRVDELPAALLIGYLNDCCRMVERGFATPDDIDTGMSLGCRMPKPFDVLAEVGPLAAFTAQQALFLETGEPGHRPSLLLEELATSDDPGAALAAVRADRGTGSSEATGAGEGTGAG